MAQQRGILPNKVSTYAVMVQNIEIHFMNSTITAPIPKTGTNLLTLATPDGAVIRLRREPGDARRA